MKETDFFLKDKKSGKEYDLMIDDDKDQGISNQAADYIQDNTTQVEHNRTMGITQQTITTLGKMSGNTAIGKITVGDQAANEFYFGSILNLSSDSVLIRIESTDFDSGYSEILLAASGSIGSRVDISRMKINWIYAVNSTEQVSSSVNFMLLYTLVIDPSDDQPIAVRIY